MLRRGGNAPAPADVPSPEVRRRVNDPLPPSELDAERRWLRAARGGDREAFGRLVLAHAAGVRRVVHRLTRDESDTEDLVQESFVRAWDTLDRFDPTRPFGPWVRRIGVNLAIDLLRRRRRRPSTADDEDLLERLPAPTRIEAEIDARRRLQIVREEMRALAPEWQAVLQLRAVEGLEYAEIAETMGTPVGTVMSRLARARARLAARLRARLGPPTEEEDA